MARIALNSGNKIVIDGSEYIVDSVIGDGATCIVYSAYYIDHAGQSHSVLLKECYPYADNVSRDGNMLLWADAEMRQESISAFKTAYEKLMAMQNTAKLRNSTSLAFDLFEANGTLYSVTNVTEGATFDKDKSKILSDILKTILALSKVVQKYHNNGYLHLDIKPENFLVIPETRELVVLFDMDSVTSIEDIKNGIVKCVPYSKGWAAPEQMRGCIDKLCPATDIYSIGAVLFQKLFNRAITPADTGIFADWDFEDEIFDNINPKIKRLLRNIFRKTLSANIKRRYQSANELIVALEEAVEVADQNTYLLSDYIVSDINFVGRKNDLLKLDEFFENGTKAVFLHGFGGVGKTALATKYAELYANKYDCVKFCRYSNGLKQIIDSLEITNASTNNNDEHRKLLKTVLKDNRILIIIDNFDVEDDEELEYLLSLNCNVLFTTRNDYSQYISSEKIEIIELESLPTDALVQVFKNEYGRDITAHEEELVQDIIEKFGNLTLIVPMIAKQILSSHISIEEFASSIEGDVFARFNEDNEDIRIRKDGKSHKTNSLDYLRAMFNIASLSAEHKTVLRYLYLLRIHKELTVTEYRKYTGERKLNTLNDLTFRGWITIERDAFKDEDNITVHQLIYDLVEKDFYPTYESVSGIANYIENCFKILENMMIPEQSISETVIDWEAAKCITFALLMYDDIRRSENKETCSKKMGILFGFMCIAFLEDAHKLHKLLFTSPEESTYYFYTHGIMDMFQFDVVENISRWSDWVKLLKNSNVENEDLRCDVGNGYVQFESQDDKQQCIEYIQKDAGLEFDSVFSNQIIVIPYFVMLLYFNSMNNDTDAASKIQTIITKLEDILQEASILNDETTSNAQSFVDKLEHRLNYYLAICNSPNYDKNAAQTHDHGLDVADNYDYYTFVLYTLQYALSLVTDSTAQENYIREAEKLIIMLEEQNDRFVWYGLSKDDVLAYVLPLEINLKENQQLHWSKKADIWYTSVEKALATTKEPYAIYKLLLNFDYQTKVLSNAKINKLLKSKFIDTIYDDVRLSAEQKSELLIDNVVSQIHSIKVSRKKTAAFVKKHTPKLQLFFDAISKATQLMPELNNYVLTGKIVLLLDFMLVLQKLLKKEAFDINEYIEKCISLDNVNYIGELIYFADKIRMAGHIKKSQYLKSMILDICYEADFETLPEDIIQMILFKVKPLANKFGRTDLIDKIDAIPISVERNYFLELIIPNSPINTSEQISIACKFLNDYIEAVLTEAYNQMHNGLPVELLDEMERLFLEYDCFLLLYANMHSNWYARIFGNRALREGAPQGAIRQLSPLELSQYTYASYDPIADIGVCYLLAKAYDDIYCDSMFNCPLEAVIDNDGSEKDYTLSSEEIQEVLENIQKICPKAKKDIDRYLEISQS